MCYEKQVHSLSHTQVDRFNEQKGGLQADLPLLLWGVWVGGADFATQALPGIHYSFRCVLVFCSASYTSYNRHPALIKALPPPAEPGGK